MLSLCCSLRLLGDGVRIIKILDLFQNYFEGFLSLVQLVS